MDPVRFWTVTLNEFMYALEGFQDGQDWFRYQMAWVVSGLLAPHIGKGHAVPTPRELLGWPAPKVAIPADPLVQAAAFDALLDGQNPEAARKAALAAKFETLKQKLAAQGQPLLEGGEDSTCP